MSVIASTIKISVATYGASQAVDVVEELGKAVIDTVVQINNMEQMLKAASGTTAAYSKNVQFLDKVASKYGTTIVETTKQYSKLLASMKSTTLTTRDAEKMFETLLAVNTKLGGSTEDLKGIVKSFYDMLSKGTVSMEELKGQLGDRLPGAMQIAADSMGLTTKELIKLVSNGQIMAEDMLPLLSQALDDTYNDGKFDTAQSNINRLSNEWFDFKSNMIDAQWVNTVIKSITSVIHSLNGLDNAISHSMTNLQREMVALRGLGKIIATGFTGDEKLFYAGVKDLKTSISGGLEDQVKSLDKEIKLKEERLNTLNNNGKKGRLHEKLISAVNGQIKSLKNQRDELQKQIPVVQKVNKVDQVRLKNINSVISKLHTQTKLEKEILSNEDKKYKSSINRIKFGKKAQSALFDKKIAEARANGQLQIVEALERQKQAKLELFDAQEITIKRKHNAKLLKLEQTKNRKILNAQKSAARKSAAERRRAQSEALAASRKAIAARKASKGFLSSQTSSLNSLRASTTDNKKDAIVLQAEEQLRKLDEVFSNAKILNSDKLEAERIYSEKKILIIKKRDQAILQIENAELAKRKRVNQSIDQFEAQAKIDQAQLGNDKIAVIELETQRRLQIEEQYYARVKEMAIKSGADLTQLEQAHTLAKSNIMKQGEKQKQEAIYHTGDLFRKWAENSTGLSEQLEGIAVNGFENMASSFADFATGSQQSFKQFAVQFIKQITAMIIKALILKAIQTALGSGGGANANGGVVNAADGNGNTSLGGPSSAQLQANVITPNFAKSKFAKGGTFTNSIVDRPTMFASGGTFGIMGEAGAEAIMPLDRNSRGELGVKIAGNSSSINSGGGSKSIVIQQLIVKVDADDENKQENANRQAAAIKKQLKQLIKSEDADSKRPGNYNNPATNIGVF